MTRRRALQPSQPLALPALVALLAAGCGPAPYTLPPDDPPTVHVAEAAPVQVEPVDEDAPEVTTTQNPFVATRHWVGSYHCPQGRTDLTVRITGAGDKLVRGVFEFNHAASGAAGSYVITGRFDRANRRIVFEPGAWIDQPDGYVSVGMDGTVSRDGTAFTGAMAHPDCGTFSLRASR